MLRPIWIAALAVVCQAQSGSPAFEVASVKRSIGAGSGGYGHRIAPDGISMSHVSLGYCIRLAYGLRQAYDLVGPDWLDPPTEVLVDIAAKAAGPVPEGHIKLMLQTLLAERFHLAVHRETRNLPVYELTLVRADAGLKRSAARGEPKGTATGRPYEIIYQHVSMAQLAERLGPPSTPRPLVDRTGLQGSFDFTLDLGRYIVDPDTGKPILDALGRTYYEAAVERGVRDQLGLVLKPGRALIEVLVVDRVERTPSGN